MFNYLLKNIPSQYLYAGYVIRKGLSSSTIVDGDKTYYDALLYSYIENNLSLFILMEDGLYKEVSTGIKLPEILEDEIVSKHLERSEYIDISDYGEYNKENPMGVYGLHSFEDLIKLEDASLTIEQQGLKIGDLKGLTLKKAYTGIEAMAVVGRFNNRNKLNKKRFCVPAIKIDSNDKFESIIGDINSYHELIKDKTPDQIIQMLYNKAQELDSTGNKKYESLGL